MRYYTDWYGVHREERFLDINGKSVERNQEEYPYSYDPYVLWKDDAYNGNIDNHVFI
jgi:hypothetical protein